MGKSRVVKALELGFALLNRRAELIITAPTGCAAESIGGSTVYTALKINTRRANDNVSKISSSWTRRSALVVDEVSMIDIKLLTAMDKQLRKARGSDFSSTALFGGLPLVVLMGDFYQFALVSGHALWDEAVGEDEIHGKTLWNNFTYVITLTEQMCQKNDSLFQALLKRARNGELNLEDVDTLNDRVATNLPISQSMDSVVVVQKNKTRHLVNRLQIERFARSQNQDILLFPAEHFRTKKDGGRIVEHEDLFNAQDGEGNCTGPGLLFTAKACPLDC